MTLTQILQLLKEGTWKALDTLYQEGLLTIGDLRYAVDQKWISIEDANMWAEVLLDC